MKLNRIFKHIPPLMGNSLLPCMLLCSTLGCFFVFAPFNNQVLNLLHLGFFICAFAALGLLVYYNRSKPVFFLILLLLCYLFINWFKQTHGVIYYTSTDYANLSFFAALGFLYFYFQPERPFISTETFRFLLVLLAGFCLTEILSKQDIALDLKFFSCPGCGLQNIGMILFIAVLIIMLVHSSIKDEIMSSSLFFAMVSVSLGFYFSAKSSTFTIFFLNAALTTILGLIHSIYYAKRKDPATGLDNGSAFVANATKLPLKYGLGIISIDDYQHLSTAFKKSGINEIVLMIIKKIRQEEPDAHLYRYSHDEFIILFPNAEKGTSFTKLDNIRRIIAGTEFMLSSRKKPLKITLSCSVTEKRRSDSTVFEVFARAQNVLQKTYKFTQNITSRA